MKTDVEKLEDNLWTAAENLRANSKLKANEYSYPVLGLIFLKFAENNFQKMEKQINAKKNYRHKVISKEDYLASGVIYLHEKARFQYLLNLPEGENLGAKINEAIKKIELDNPDLVDTLPKIYNILDNSILIELLRLFDEIPTDIEGDAFGKIYEFFLSSFAMSEGQKGGEFFTPISIVKLIVEILEPYEGRIYDPACGSGGMFVQSAEFVKNHSGKNKKKLSIFGQEKTSDTVKLNKMNLAVHGLAGDIKQGITYYEDLHSSINKFDYVMANPPFNVKKVDKEKIKDDPRYDLGIPSHDNANYLWIQIFLNALNDNGRAGFVMANSAAESSGGELEIRKKIINSHVVDIIVSIGKNFFYTVTLPCNLWFFDKRKVNSLNKESVLFIDAREIYNQVDRSHREFTSKNIEFISNIVNLYRGNKIKNKYSTKEEINSFFPNNKYIDVPGLCKAVNIHQLANNNWSLNPGRYVGVSADSVEENNLVFNKNIVSLKTELNSLNFEARNLEDEIDKDLDEIIKSNS